MWLLYLIILKNIYKNDDKTTKEKRAIKNGTEDIFFIYNYFSFNSSIILVRYFSRSLYLQVRINS